MGKVTMQDIADALGISRVSVWKVFNRQEGVSDSLKEQVMNMAASMGYTRYQIDSSSEDSIAREKSVSVIVSRPESAFFWTNIIHQIAKEFSGMNVNLLYTYAPSIYTPIYSLPNILSGGDVDGVIVLNIYDSTLTGMISALPIPKVFLDSVTRTEPSDLHGDLVLLEGTEITAQLTNHLIDKGCRRIGFIGDISYARTNNDRYNGFRKAMATHNLSVSMADCLISPLGIESYHNDIFSFLDRMDHLPDAFVCASDYVAHFVYLSLEQKGLSVPKDIMITGYDNATEYENVAGRLTTVDVNTAFIGRRLARELMYRIEHPDDPSEVIYVNSNIIYNTSTAD